MKEGILLCGHGSRREAAITSFKKLVTILQNRYEKEYEVDYGFLEFNHPTYEAAVERMYLNGIRKVYALPVILFAGSHAKNDIPYELNTIQSYHEDLTITMSKHIGVNSFLLDLAVKRIEETEATLTPMDRKETCLVVVGRGTTDPDANSDVCKLTSMLWEGMGYGFATTAYSGTAYPKVDESLQMIEKLGFKRTIVIPFFFFTGVLLERIYGHVTTMNTNSDQEFIYTAPFGTDELLMKAFDERLEEAKTGTAYMNCQLCKYRKQVVGFEQDYGAEQVGHHLNVKGILFEEDEKPGEVKNSLGTKIKKVLGI
ncbi:sirohydrochlorin chelatase [Aquimarina sp. AD10]|uniref:sirohydrochlorin chelatase n=1 Tax=Aquimarina sp. AD10 TaxID=1714849 RepID=UPI000E4EAF0C|nr:sirohydrochlorin chelatase [Aquimarina sp. AD10]AXT63044.1 sirohydrochlorin chelatase [Aquimarina sp. AD10]RKM96845.1 sirohydrochlorin chelatase [Aquimarina sp. AD10]